MVRYNKNALPLAICARSITIVLKKFLRCRSENKTSVFMRLLLRSIYIMPVIKHFREIYIIIEYTYEEFELIYIIITIIIL